MCAELLAMQCVNDSRAISQLRDLHRHAPGCAHVFAQGFLITTNSFAAAWRSRASAESIRILSSAAHELLAYLSPANATAVVAGGKDTAVAGDLEGTGNTTSPPGRKAGLAAGNDIEGGDYKRVRRAPSKWRRFAEQAEFEFRQLNSDAVLVSAAGQAHAQQGLDLRQAENTLLPPDKNALDTLRFSPMKVDLRCMHTTLLPPYAAMKIRV